MPTAFDARAYVPRDLYDGITDIRVRQPGSPTPRRTGGRAGGSRHRTASW